MALDFQTYPLNTDIIDSVSCHRKNRLLTYMKKNGTISHKELLKLNKDYQRAAKAANLTYCNPDSGGITRVKSGKSYSFYQNGKKITDKVEIERIKKLAIPPSWSNVWICPRANGHLQATGLDLNKRKQYRYHEKWHSLRSETKFHRMIEFGKSLPLLREKVKQDLSIPDLNETKVLAAAINLMEQTYIRVGNNEYEKLYGSYGLTTLKDQHVEIKKENIKFSFTGKKGIDHNITLKNKKLAKVIKECRDVPGKSLFQFYTENGDKKTIDSGMVNSYIREASQQDFSAKDFRTWAGTLEALQCIQNLEETEDVKLIKKNIAQVLEDVSIKLGNTRNICRKYYIHPGLFKLYEENKLLKYVKNWGKKSTQTKGLNLSEQLLMSVLQKCASIN